jgi:glycerol-3-phosphate dehydrogenase
VSSSTAYDVVIIGGGINGAGIARDAALRGLEVLLLEQNDFGSGTSSWSSRLIHGGLRYLEHGAIPLVHESLRERRVLQEIAPHLITRLCINIPVYDHSKRGMVLLRAGMIAYDLLSLGKPLPNHRVLNREQFLRNEPGVNPSGLRGGVQYYDAQVAFAERLVFENILAAHNAGAVVENYSPVTSIVVEGGRVSHVVYRHRTGEERHARAQVVVNASGPWVDDVLSKTTLPGRKLIGGTKGSHIIVGAFAGAPKDAFYVEARADGRPFFIIPWNGQYLIGTTDIRYDGDPAEAVASLEEIEYLLEETNRVFPQANLGTADIHYTYTGVRPLPRTAGPESAITRKHIIRRHDDAKGLWTVIGGKLTTYRSLAEDAVDRILRRSGREASTCRTREEPLPGAAGLDALATMSAGPQIPEKAIARLRGIYGGRAGNIFELVRSEPPLASEAVRGSGILAAEVVFNIRFEFARTLIDILHRRTMTGLSPDLGRSAAVQIAAVAARELGWSEKETEQQLSALCAYNEKLMPTCSRSSR